MYIILTEHEFEDNQNKPICIVASDLRYLFDNPQCSIGDVLANVELVVVHNHPLVIVTIHNVNPCNK